MSKKHVEKYYLQMVADYTEMKNLLEELQKDVTEDTAATLVNSINSIKDQVKLLEANYKRLAYIMFLLDTPNRKKKESGYLRREHKKLAQIPLEHRQESVEKENRNILSNIKSIKEQS